MCTHAPFVLPLPANFCKHHFAAFTAGAFDKHICNFRLHILQTSNTYFHKEKLILNKHTSC